MKLLNAASQQWWVCLPWVYIKNREIWDYHVFFRWFRWSRWTDKQRQNQDPRCFSFDPTTTEKLNWQNWKRLTNKAKSAQVCEIAKSDKIWISYIQNMNINLWLNEVEFQHRCLVFSKVEAAVRERVGHFGSKTEETAAAAVLCWPPLRLSPILRDKRPSGVIWTNCLLVLLASLEVTVVRQSVSAPSFNF